MRPLRVAAFTLAALAFGGVMSVVRAQDDEVPESAVKAAFLYNFGTYVEWPEPNAADDPLTIAVLGDDAVFAQLDRFLPGRTIDERPVVVRRLRELHDLESDEILFLGRAVSDRLEAMLSTVASTSACLIVTDDPNGIMPGAGINFRLTNDRIQFEIDRLAATAYGLSLSSRLLDAADQVFGNAPATIPEDQQQQTEQSD
jgi:hypothetical protein